MCWLGAGADDVPGAGPAVGVAGAAGAAGAVAVSISFM